MLSNCMSKLGVLNRAASLCGVVQFSCNMFERRPRAMESSLGESRFAISECGEAACKEMPS